MALTEMIFIKTWYHLYLEAKGVTISSDNNLINLTLVNAFNRRLFYST